MRIEAKFIPTDAEIMVESKKKPNKQTKNKTKQKNWLGVVYVF